MLVIQFILFFCFTLPLMTFEWRKELILRGFFLDNLNLIFFCPEAAVCGGSSKYVFLKISQYSLENTCVEVFF